MRLSGVAAPIVVAAALAAATLWVAYTDARYRVVEPELLANADLGGGARWWGAAGHVIAGDPNVLAIPGRGTGPVPAVHRAIPGSRRFDHVRISLEARAEGVPRPLAGWHGAHVDVLSNDARGRRLWYWPQTVARLHGTTAWERHVRTIPRGEPVASMGLYLYVAAEGGRLLVRNLRVEGAVERPAFVALHYALAAAWAGAWAWVVVALWRRAGRGLLPAAALALGTFVVVAGTVPQPHLGDAQTRVLHGAQDAWYSIADRLTRPAADEARTPGEAPGGSPGAADGRDAAGETRGAGEAAAAGPGRADAGEAPGGQGASEGRPAPREYWAPRIPNPDQSGHVLAFGVLALVAAFAWRRQPSRDVLLGLVALAASIQALQGLSVTREPDLLDLQADCLGILIGAGSAYLSLLAAGRLRSARWPGDPRAPRGRSAAPSADD